MRETERIENILKASRQARNSDTELLIIYMQKSGMELTERQQAKFRTLPSFETLTRIRRKLQEQGKYPADKEVEELRYAKYTKTKQAINNEDPETVLSSQGIHVLPWGQ